MAVLSYKNFPLRVAQKIKSGVKTIENSMVAFSDIVLPLQIQSIYKSDYIIGAVYRKNILFHFMVVDAKIERDEVIALLKYCPESNESTETTTVTVSPERIQEHFHYWLDMVLDYALLDDESFSTEELEFYESFKSQYCPPFDTQANLPLPKDMQDKMLAALQNLKKTVEEQAPASPEKEAILAEIAKLEDRLSLLSKKQAVSQAAKIFARVKKAGVQLIYKGLEEGVKEAVKLLVKGGTDMIS